MTYSWFQTFAVFWILCVIFWVFPRHLIIECRRFGTLYLFHLFKGRIWSVKYFTLHIQPLKMEQIECSETSAFNNNQMPGKYPKDYTQYSIHGESLKSRTYSLIIHKSINHEIIFYAHCSMSKDVLTTGQCCTFLMLKCLTLNAVMN